MEREVRITALGKSWSIDLDDNNEVYSIDCLNTETRIYENVPSVLWTMEVEGFTLVDSLGDIARDEPEFEADPAGDYADRLYQDYKESY
jgi:hypothetical protein